MCTGVGPQSTGSRGGTSVLQERGRACLGWTRESSRSALDAGGVGGGSGEVVKAERAFLIRWAAGRLAARDEARMTFTDNVNARVCSGAGGLPSVGRKQKATGRLARAARLLLACAVAVVDALRDVRIDGAGITS